MLVLLHLIFTSPRFETFLLFRLSSLPDQNLAISSQYFDYVSNRITVLFKPKFKKTVNQGLSDHDNGSLKSSTDTLSTPDTSKSPSLTLQLSNDSTHSLNYNGLQVSDGFELILSRKLTFDTVTSRLGSKLGVSPLRLRLSSLHPNSRDAKHIIKRNPLMPLSEMVGTPPNQAFATLYYEILDVDITELDHKRYIRVSWKHQ